MASIDETIKLIGQGSSEEGEMKCTYANVFKVQHVEIDKCKKSNNYILHSSNLAKLELLP